jgi:hypothetical protein
LSDPAFVGDAPAPSLGPPKTILRSVYEIDPLVLEQLAQWFEQRGLRTTLSQITGLQGLKTSFLRAFGPTAATAIPANVWTTIPLTGTWRQFGQTDWQLIVAGDPDYATYPGCIRCLREGIYDLVGAVIFDASNQTGDRGVYVHEMTGAYAGQWQLVQSTPMPKVAGGAVLVSGETYQYIGNIIGLQAQATVTTATTANPNSEFLSATFIGRP